MKAVLDVGSIEAQTKSQFALEEKEIIPTRPSPPSHLVSFVRRNGKVYPRLVNYQLTPARERFLRDVAEAAHSVKGKAKGPLEVAKVVKERTAGKNYGAVRKIPKWEAVALIEAPAAIENVRALAKLLESLP